MKLRERLINVYEKQGWTNSEAVMKADDLVSKLLQKESEEVVNNYPIWMVMPY